MKIYFALLSLYLFHSVFGLRRSEFRDGEFTDRIVFTTSRKDDPKIWFNKEHPGFEYIEQFRIGKEVYIKAQIRQTRTREKLSTVKEDNDVNLLRRSPGIKWVQQEKGHVRVPKTVDTEWSNLWYLNDDVTPTMKVSSAWSPGYSGSGIVIAVVDDGLQTNHPDLAANVDTINDKDIYGFDNNPNPPIGKSHGTQVSGLIAAVKDNNICVVGVAFNSTLIDSEEAQGISHYLTNVDIYSNSWGPADGTGFNGPGSLTKAALQDGVTNGRNGKGAIYIWAAGNGGTEDNCNADGYVNSIYTVAISSAMIGSNAWYSEVCAPVLAAAYGGSEDDRFLTTTTTSSGCTSEGIQGTSYAAPIVTGIVALTLEANPDLTWRDIQHLIAFTSTRNGLNDTYSDWSMNGANKEFSQLLGFGLIDADAMVSYGNIWVTVPTQQTCITSTSSPSVSTNTFLSDSVTVTSGDCSLINYLEHVVADITFSYSGLRGMTHLYLISPSGTRSHLLHHRTRDASDNVAAGSLTWDFMSVHFWKENPIGIWILELRSENVGVTVTLNSWSLTFYGTTTDPWPETITDSVTTPDAVTTKETTTDAVTTTETPTDAVTTETTTDAETTTETTTDAVTTTETTTDAVTITETTTGAVTTTETITDAVTTTETTTGAVTTTETTTDAVTSKETTTNAVTTTEITTDAVTTETIADAVTTTETTIEAVATTGSVTTTETTTNAVTTETMTDAVTTTGVLTTKETTIDPVTTQFSSRATDTSSMNTTNSNGSDTEDDSSTTIIIVVTVTTIVACVTVVLVIIKCFGTGCNVVHPSV